MLRPEIARQILDLAYGPILSIPSREELEHRAVAVFCRWWGEAMKGMCERMKERERCR